MSEETKIKIWLANKGHKVSKEVRIKLSKFFKINPNKWFQWKKHSKRSILKMKKSLKWKTPWNKWMIWSTSLAKKIRNSEKYKQWRSNVFQRDKWTCQTCYMRWIELNAHHIKEFAKIIKENNIKTIEEADKCEELWNTNNWVTLCHRCHKLTESYWKNILE